MEKKVLDFLRRRIDSVELDYAIRKTLLWRCPISIAFPILVDKVNDLLEEFREDNDLTEEWSNHIDVEELIMQL